MRSFHPLRAAVGLTAIQCVGYPCSDRHVVYYTGSTNLFLYDMWWSIFDDMCASEHVKCIQAEPGKFLTELGLENSAPA